MSRRKIYTLVITAFLCLNLSAEAQPQLLAYDLRHPEINLNLPGNLIEISGLTALDDETFACVQDEKGILFIYDAKENTIKDQHNFHLDGDYEGVTEANGSIFILRSDGKLFEITNYKSANFKVNTFETQIPAKNNEGLCFDQKNDRLLIASKSKPTDEPKKTPNRVIYGFDLKTKKLSSKPAFEFDVNQLETYAKKHKITLPSKTKKDGSKSTPGLKLKTSAIAIHPISGALYVLSAKDHFLFIFNPDGTLITMTPLDEKLFNKAEGITFFKNGDMLITNEGDKDEAEAKPATALIFKHMKH